MIIVQIVTLIILSLLGGLIGWLIVMICAQLVGHFTGHKRRQAAVLDELSPRQQQADGPPPALLNLAVKAPALPPYPIVRIVCPKDMHTLCRLRYLMVAADAAGYILVPKPKEPIDAP